MRDELHIVMLLPKSGETVNIEQRPWNMENYQHDPNTSWKLRAPFSQREKVGTNLDPQERWRREHGKTITIKNMRDNSRKVCVLQGTFLYRIIDSLPYMRA